MRTLLLLFALACTSSIGCGPESDPIAVTPPAIDAQLRSALTEIEKSGEPLGSGGMVIQEGIEAIRAQDPSKASALEAEYQNLAAASTPAAVKSAAKAMLDKLK